MIDRVQELLFRAEFFVKFYMDIIHRYDKYRPKGNRAIEIYYWENPVTKLALLQANLYFMESISCLASLLSDEGREEVSFVFLAKNLSEPKKTKFLKKRSLIFNQFKKRKLDIIRNKIADHKDRESSGDPITHFMNPINPYFVEGSQFILKELFRLFEEFFPHEMSTDDFSDYFKKSRDLFLEFISEKMELIQSLDYNAKNE